MPLKEHEKASIEDIRKILLYLSKGYKVPQIIYDTIFDTAVREIEKKKLPVVIKRDPNIDRGRIQGSFCKIIKGETAEINPSVVGRFGMDFDGDSIVGQLVYYIYNTETLEYTPHRIHIKKLKDVLNLELDYEKTKEGGIVVSNYKVLDDNIYVNAIDKETGKIQKKKVTHWSEHKNLDMYKITRLPRIAVIDPVEPLWVSDDHSIVAYNEEKMELERITPKDVINNKENYTFIRHNKSEDYQHPIADYLDIFKNKNVSESDAGFLIGGYLGDGYISYSGQNLKDKPKSYGVFALSNSNDNISDKWCDILENVSINKVNRKEDRKSMYPHARDFKTKDGNNTKVAKRSKTQSVDLCREITTYFNRGSANKTLPSWIINTTDEFIYGLIGGYFSTDGTISGKYMSFTTKSEELAYSLSHLLKSKFNLNMSIYEDCKKTYLDDNGKEHKTNDESKFRYYYIVQLAINSESKEFINNVIPYILDNDKVNKIQKIINGIKETSRYKGKLTYIPYELIENMSIKDRKEFLGLSQDHISKIKKCNYCQLNVYIPEVLINNSNLSDTCKTLLFKQNKNEIEFIPCELLNVEYDPDETIGYDLTVEDYMTFTTADGIFVYDTIGIFAVLSKEAQEEVINKLITTDSNYKLNATSFELSKEALLGLFTMTYLENKKKTPIATNDLEKIKSLHIGDPVIYTADKINHRTTAGRVIVNKIFPEYVPFINEVFNKKVINNNLNKLSSFNKKDYVQTIDELMRVGFTYATRYPQTVSLDMLMIPKELEDLKVKLSKEKNIDEQVKIVDKMEELLMKHIEKNQPELLIHVKSGAAKGGSQLRQMMVAKGIITDAYGNILDPISKSLVEGYDSESYFEAAAAGRKGIIDRALNTASGGYLYRKMVYVMANVEGDITLPDCGTKNTAKIKLTNELFDKMQGRYKHDENGRIVRVDSNDIGKVINLRSPMFCKSRKVCRTCYGDLMLQLKSKNIGLNACLVVSLSEKIMKCVNGMVEIDGKLYAMEDIYEMIK